MGSADLLRLWKLHKVDRAIVEVRQRAAALDSGRAIQTQIAALDAEFALVDGEAKRLSGEQHDLELKQSGIEDKLKRIDKELYGGSVVNSREVENLQKEIAILKKQSGDIDERLLELWELAPPAKAASDAIGQKIAERKEALAEYQTKVVAAKAQLEAEFKLRSEQRPELAAGIPKLLMERYEFIRQKHDGIGMARITGLPASCEMCGTLLPERLIEVAKEDRVATCDSCHRILYWSESVL